MKLLYINTVPTERNGVTNVICNLLGAMDTEGLTADLLCINEPERRYRELAAGWGGSVHVLSRSISHPIRYVRRLKKLLKEGGYEAVHVHGNSATMALEMLAARLAGVRVRIAHSHNTTCRYMTVHRLLSPLFQALCTHRLACGEEAGKWLYGKRDFTVINNGVETARFAYCPENRQELREKLGIGAGKVLLGHVGTFNEAKNQGFLIEMLARLPEGYALVLVGEGPLRGSLEEKAQALAPGGRVCFAGVTDRAEDFFSAFDLLVMPSLYEGLPLTLVEAQSSGLPCLVSDRITKEVDMTGLLRYLPLEQEAWTEAVKAAAASERQEASRQAVEKIRAAGYDVRDEAAKLKLFYRKALAEGTEGR